MGGIWHFGRWVAQGLVGITVFVSHSLSLLTLYWFLFLLFFWSRTMVKASRMSNRKPTTNLAPFYTNPTSRKFHINYSLLFLSTFMSTQNHFSKLSLHKWKTLSRFLVLWNLFWISFLLIFILWWLCNTRWICVENWRDGRFFFFFNGETKSKSQI